MNKLKAILQISFILLVASGFAYLLVMGHIDLYNGMSADSSPEKHTLGVFAISFDTAALISALIIGTAICLENFKSNIQSIGNCKKRQ